MASGVSGDLQPYTGKLHQSETGPNPGLDAVFIPITRVSGVEEQDLMDIDGKRWRIQYILDFAPTYPQEIFLSRLSDPGE